MAAPEVPGWTGQGGYSDQAWNQVGLGDIYLPGVCSIEGLSVGIKVDVKSPKGSDQPTSKDNGVEPSKFQIRVTLTEKDWPFWLACLPTFHPRRPGRTRSPLEILHPEPNSLGIQHVRVTAIKATPPTARGGKAYIIDCTEWFPEQKAQSKKSEKTKAGPPAPASQLEGIDGVLEHVDKRQKEGVSTADVASPENYINNLASLNQPPPGV